MILGLAMIILELVKFRINLGKERFMINPKIRQIKSNNFEFNVYRPNLSGL